VIVQRPCAGSAPIVGSAAFARRMKRRAIVVSLYFGGVRIGAAVDDVAGVFSTVSAMRRTA